MRWRWTCRPAGEHEVYLRVMTQSSMLVLISFLRSEAFLVQQSSRQLLQGLAAGIALGLLAYSWRTGRACVSRCLASTR